MALMLPAALQLSSGQSDDPALKMFPAKIAVDAEQTNSAPNVSILTNAPFGAAAEEGSNLVLPSQAEPVKTEAYFEKAAAEALLVGRSTCSALGRKTPGSARVQARWSKFSAANPKCTAAQPWYLALASKAELWS